MIRPFTLHRPASAEEACTLLATLGDDAVAYAGGTELLLLMKEGLLRPRHLVDVKRIPGLDRIAVDIEHGGPTTQDPQTPVGGIAIGATVTHRALEHSTPVRDVCPVVTSVARHVANVRVRNVGTVGGNLAFADPHSDLATLFLAFDADVHLVSPRGRRAISLEAFVRGPWETERAPDELLASVAFSPLRGRTGAAYVKFGIYERPTLGIAVALSLEAGAGRVTEARIAIGCVNPRPTRARDAEARLRGCAVAELDDVIGAVAALAAAGADPADDLHGSAEYKREMVAVFTRRALRVAAARARGSKSTARYEHAVVA
jgi:carbon-monoxide dehydrogenase medium subunit